MNIRNRSFIIIFSQSLTRLTTIILGIILVRIVSQQTFGTYRQVNLVYVILASAFSLQLDSSLYYFVPKLDINSRRTLMFQTLLITIGLASVIAVIMFTGAGVVSKRFNNPELIPLVRIFALYPFVERLIVLVPAFMISLDRPARAGVYTIVSSAGRMAAVIITFALGYGLVEVMWAIVLVSGAIAIIGCLDITRFCPSGQWSFDKFLVLEQLHYTWPLLAGMIVATLNLQLDKVLISVFLGTQSYAIYSCGAMQLPVVSIITASLSYAMMPELVKILERGDSLKALSIWQEGARKCSLVIFPCFIFFFVTGFDFITLLYGREYSQAAWPFRIYLLSLPLKVAVYATLFRAAGKTGPIAKGAVIALVINAVVSISLVSLGRKGFLTFIGPAIGTVIATWCAWLYLLIKIRPVASVTFTSVMRWKELGQILIVSAVCGVVLWFIPLLQMPLLLKLIIQALIYLTVFLILVLSTGMLKKDEKQLLCLPFTFVWQLLSKKRNK